MNETTETSAGHCAGHPEPKPVTKAQALAKIDAAIIKLNRVLNLFDMNNARANLSFICTNVSTARDLLWVANAALRQDPAPLAPVALTQPELVDAIGKGLSPFKAVIDTLTARHRQLVTRMTETEARIAALETAIQKRPTPHKKR